MNDWQSTYLGRGALPRDLSGFEIEAFFTYCESERRVIDDERRSSALKLALALQIGFLRMTGRLLEALRLVPPALWRHLGAQFEIDAPDLASLRTMYRRRRTLFEQQDLACSVLGFHDVTEAQRRALIRAINAELSRTSDRQRLLQFARRWLYDHKQIIPRERELRGYIAKAIRQHEATLVSEIVEAIDPDLLAQWRKTITQPREDGATVQSWLWAAPAKHSTRQIDRVLERIELLTSLKVDQHLAELPEAIVRRYARRLASRAPSQAARGDAGGGRRLKPAGEPGDGLEYDEDAVGARPLERPTFHRRAAGTDRAHRPDAHGGHQLARRIHLPDRAIPGPTITVTSSSKITRLWRLNGPSERRKTLLSQQTEWPLYSAGYWSTWHFFPCFRARSTGTFGTEIKGTP